MRKAKFHVNAQKNFIKNKVKDIEEKITTLAELKTKLSELLKLKRYEGTAKSICPIIETEKTS